MKVHTANQHKASRRPAPSGTTEARLDNSHVITIRPPEMEKRPTRICEVGRSLGTKLSSFRCLGQYGCKGTVLVVMFLWPAGSFVHKRGQRDRKTPGGAIAGRLPNTGLRLSRKTCRLPNSPSSVRTSWGFLQTSHPWASNRRRCRFEE